MARLISEVLDGLCADLMKGVLGGPEVIEAMVFPKKKCVDGRG
jgi:hypothetical protein